MRDDRSYYAARAGEERRLAMASADSNVRKVHLEMAAKYAAIAVADSAPIKEMVVESEQKTA